MDTTLRTVDGRAIRWLTPKREPEKYSDAVFQPVLLYRPLPEKPDSTVKDRQVAFCERSRKFFRAVSGEWEPIR
jgi:hypothetical protein